MLVEDFERRGTLVEKYDVERRTSEVGGKLAFGYTEQRDRLRLDQRRRHPLLMDMGAGSWPT